MWKYVTRRIRDTFEKSVNTFDIRSSSGLTQQGTNGKSKETCLAERSEHKCCGVFGKQRETNKKNCFDYYIYHWIGAITWSSALVLGWYGSQFIRFKRRDDARKKLALTTQERDKFAASLAALALGFVPAECKKPYIKFSKTAEISAQNSNCCTDKPLLISNDFESEIISEEDAIKKGNKAAVDSATQNLSNVLNSIENRLGMAAIQNGDHEGGLTLLRSAAKRNHAPALYNLALCYEQGLGLAVDDKMALELYRSAAKMEHPTAMYNLAVFYGQGRGGLAPDRVLATRLLHLAAYKGQEDAIKALQILKKETPNDNNNVLDGIEVTPKDNYTPFSFPVCPVSYGCDRLKGGLYAH